MAARRKARRRALDILFEAELRGQAPLEVLAEVRQRRALGGEPPLNPYTDTLVTGVVAHLADIDEQLATYAIGWSLDRMPAVDRNVLRIGAFELLFDRAVPTGVAVSEAVLLAKDLSTDESPRFVNGLLSRLAKMHPRESAEPASGASVEDSD
jgi:N utilization substance protein B